MVTGTEMFSALCVCIYSRVIIWRFYAHARILVLRSRHPASIPARPAKIDQYWSISTIIFMHKCATFAELLKIGWYSHKVMSSQPDVVIITDFRRHLSMLM